MQLNVTVIDATEIATIFLTVNARNYTVMEREASLFKIAAVEAMISMSNTTPTSAEQFTDKVQSTLSYSYD